MIRVKVTTSFPDWPLIRQTPGSMGVWGDCRFFIDDDCDECDYWVIYDSPGFPVRAKCPSGNVILITCEPPGVKVYPNQYTNQFASVITCLSYINHPSRLIQQQALPWHVKSKSYDDLTAMPTGQKTKLVSVISSNKAFTAGHRKRLRFVQALKEAMGDQIDVFGRGIREIPEKWDALADYQYTVVIENDHLNDWWTEKIADAYLAQCLPIYYGCPNLTRYFCQDAFIPIDITRPAAAVERIRGAISSDLYSRRAGALAEAKRLVLEEYQFFPMVTQFISTRGRIADPSSAWVEIDPLERYLQPGLKTRLRPYLTKALSLIGLSK